MGPWTCSRSFTLDPRELINLASSQPYFAVFLEPIIELGKCEISWLKGGEGGEEGGGEGGGEGG